MPQCGRSPWSLSLIHISLKISKDPLLEEPAELIQQEKTDDSEENAEETGTAESGTTGTQGTDADIKEEKAPKTAYDNDDSLDLDSEEYDLSLIHISIS